MLLDTFLLPARIVVFFGYLLVVFACFCLFFSLVAHELLLGLASRFLVYRLKFLLNFGLFVYAVGTLVGFRLLRETLKDVLDEFPVVFDQLVAEEFLEFGFEFAGGTAQGLGFWVFPVLIASLFTSFFEHHLYLVFFFYCFVPVGWWFRLLQGGAELAAVIPIVSGSQAVEKALQQAVRSDVIMRESAVLSSPEISVPRLEFHYQTATSPVNLKEKHLLMKNYIPYRKAIAEMLRGTMSFTSPNPSVHFDLYHADYGRYGTKKLNSKWGDVHFVAKTFLYELNYRFVADLPWSQPTKDCLEFIAKNPDHSYANAFSNPEVNRDLIFEFVAAEILKGEQAADFYVRLPKNQPGDFALSKGGVSRPAVEVKGIWIALPPDKNDAVRVILQKLYGLRTFDKNIISDTEASPSYS